MTDWDYYWIKRKLKSGELTEAELTPEAMRELMLIEDDKYL